MQNNPQLQHLQQEDGKVQLALKAKEMNMLCHVIPGMSSMTSALCLLSSCKPCMVLGTKQI